MNRNTIFEAIMNAEIEAKNNIAEADKILNDIDVNSHDPIGQSPLHFASQNGFAFSVNTFIRKGADVNELNHMGKSPLYLASEYGHYSIVSSLLNCPALNLTLQTNYTALHIASENGHSSIVKMLLRKGIDVNSKDKYGFTPIMVACYEGKDDIVSLLLTKDADISIRNINNLSCLDIARNWNHTKIVDILERWPTTMGIIGLQGNRVSGNIEMDSYIDLHEFGKGGKKPKEEKTKGKNNGKLGNNNVKTF
jgi:ankyrin repeat protein